MGRKKPIKTIAAPMVETLNQYAKGKGISCRIEFDAKARRYVILLADGVREYESQQAEAVAAHLDMMALAILFG